MAEALVRAIVTQVRHCQKAEGDLRQLLTAAFADLPSSPQLAAEGAVALFYKFSRRTFAELVKAGREWEEDTALPSRRRRVPLEDEVD